MLGNCIYTYIVQQAIYVGSGKDRVNLAINSFYKDKTAIRRPISIVNGKLAPVEWYYQLFTEAELKKALEKFDSPFPTKIFLVFNQLPTITLGASGKELVRFDVVDKDTVDEFIKNTLKS